MKTDLGSMIDTIKFILHRNYIWEILHGTIRKMNKHVSRLQREVNEARERRTGRESDDSSSDEDDQRPRPSEEDIERMEEKLEGAQSDQKNLFLIIFQVVKLLVCLQL